MKRASLLMVSVSCLGLVAALVHCGDDDATAPGGGTDAGSDGTTTTTPTDAGSTPTPDAGGGGGGSDAGDAGPKPLDLFAVDDANQLVKFTSTAPGTVTKVAITGASPLVGIDFRPSTKALYGIASDAKLYTIDVASGVATQVPAGADAGVATFPVVFDVAAMSYGFDFNPAADRIRVHNDRGQNYRLHPANGGSVNAAGDGALTYEDGGAAASIVGAAYTNSVDPKPSTTALFGIDPALNQLNAFFTPDGGTAGGFAGVRRVGALGVDVGAVAGFDIHGGASSADAGAPVNTPLQAYAAFTVGAELSLYRIDLATGSAAKVGAIGHDKPLRGLAIRP